MGGEVWLVVAYPLALILGPAVLITIHDRLWLRKAKRKAATCPKCGGMMRVVAADPDNRLAIFSCPKCRYAEVRIEP